MKRILCLILALLLLTPSVYADVTDLPTMTVTLSANAVKVGDTVRVTASVKDAPICASYHIIYSYDTAVLKPIEGKNLYTGGLFTININPKDKGTINTVAADSKKVIEGNLPIFYTDFEVIGTPAEGSGTPLKFTKLEFYTSNLEKVVNLRSEPCTIPIIGTGTTQPPEKNENETENETETENKPELETPADPDKPLPGDPELIDPAPSAPVTGTTTPEPENSGSTTGNTPSTEVDVEITPVMPEESEGEDPTGDWEFNEEKQEVTLSDPDGDETTYTYEPIIDPETNQQSGVVLYDKDGNEAGKLQVEKDENGKLQVLKQFLPKADLSFLYFLIPIALAVLACGGLVAFAVIKNKKAKETEPAND